LSLIIVFFQFIIFKCNEDNFFIQLKFVFILSIYNTTSVFKFALHFLNDLFFLNYQWGFPLVNKIFCNFQQMLPHRVSLSILINGKKWKWKMKNILKLFKNNSLNFCMNLYKKLNFLKRCDVTVNRICTC